MSHFESSEKWLIAVTAGRWQTHGILQAKNAGLKVLAIDADGNAEGLVHADRALVRDLKQQEEIAQEILAMQLPIAGAISFCSEAGMPLTGFLREKLNLPGPKGRALDLLFDKALQRATWQMAQVPGPQWRLCQTAQMALTAINELGRPCIVKPVDSSGSRGVTRIEAQTDASEAIARAFQFSKSGRVLVESYMDGTEFTVEVFAHQGDVHVLAVTEKKKVPGTGGCVAFELATPIRPKAIVEKLSAAVVAAFKSLGYTDGPGHAEVILMPSEEVGLVEVAGRGGGFMVFDRLVPAVSGVNLARLCALQAVGEPLPAFSIQENSGVLRFFPSRPGFVSSLTGFDEATKIPGVEAEPFVKVGQKVGSAQADGDRLGYILSRAPTPEGAQDLADQAESFIRFEVSSL